MTGLVDLVDRLRGSVDAGVDVTLHPSEAVLLVDLASASLDVDPNYEERQGYDAGFLGNVAVLLPAFPDEAMAADRVPVGDTGFELRYHHFSVVMSASRKLAFVTAVNIDGRRQISIDRTNDVWIFDPRIPKEQQIGDELYDGDALDRGHLVRRMDPDWGDSVQEAMFANDDTFHFSNCSPQHESFNRSSTAWKGLEDYILNNASAASKVNVFSGPVLAESDPSFRGVQIPEQFWKVVTTLRDDGTLSATAYLLSQKDLIGGLETVGFTFGQFRTFQVPVATIEQLTGLSFGLPAGAEPAGLAAAADLQGAELFELSDIRL